MATDLLLAVYVVVGSVAFILSAGWGAVIAPVGALAAALGMHLLGVTDELLLFLTAAAVTSILSLLWQEHVHYPDHRYLYRALRDRVSPWRARRVWGQAYDASFDSDEEWADKGWVIAWMRVLGITGDDLGEERPVAIVDSKATILIAYEVIETGRSVILIGPARRRGGGHRRRRRRPVRLSGSARPVSVPSI